MQLQKIIKSVVKENFEFRNTRNGTRVITKTLADFAAVKSHLDTNNLPYFTSYRKYLKPFKAVIRHLPMNTPAEDISEGLMELGFDIINVKQVTSTRRSQSKETPTKNLPLLPRTAKSQEIFRLTALCHIAIRVEVYRAQNGLMQCYNCQHFGHIWANCKQPPVVYGAGAATCTRSAQKNKTLLPHQHAVTASWRRERKPIPPIIEAAYTPRRSCRRGNHREHPRLQREGCSPQTLLLQASPSRRRSEVAQHNSRGLRHAKFQWQIQLQQEN
jgi:hypothetical protein